VPLHCDLARKAIADAGLSSEIEVVEAAAESMPLADGSADWIWCRDVLVHVDAQRGLAECARVLRPGGSMVAYVTLATDRLEPRERAELVETMGLKTFDVEEVEAAARDAGLALSSVDQLGSEWRERMIEDKTWDPAESLLHLARLRRSGIEGPQAQAAYGGLVWGIYQMLGKLCPTVYVWTSSG
jgi:SAM-dependent methyltransferase